MSLNLAESLKTQTKALHTQLERSTLMRSLLRGEMKRAPYCALLRNFHEIYAALEPLLVQHAAHPGVAPLFFPGLFRSQSLADDLAELHGAGWFDEIDTQPAARRYAKHLREIAAHRPGLLVAHAYVRYLGDLSGGQMLRRIVAGSLELDHGRGTRFYDFGSPAEVAVQVQAFRAGLVSLTLDAAELSAVVAEAVASFERHQQLFDELAPAARSPEQTAAPARVSVTPES